MMSEPHTLQLAIKYACRLKYMQLAERISEVVQRKSAEQAEEVEEEEEEVVHRVQRSRSCLLWKLNSIWIFIKHIFSMSEDYLI